MDLNNLFSNTLKMVKSNSPEILSGLSIAGVIGTSYLVGKSSFKAKEMIDEAESGYDVRVIAGIPYPNELPLKDKAKLVWKCYIPPAATGVLTIACIIGSQKSNSRRTAAAVTAYSLTERAFAEYKEKVIEQVGKGKEQKIRDAIAQDKVTKNPPKGEVLMLGTGEVLCCELLTHRYFKSDMDSLRKAENTINHMINNQYYVVLEDFYDLINLPHTSDSAQRGWDSNKLMELCFTTVLSEQGEPCIAFDYNYIRPMK